MTTTDDDRLGVLHAESLALGQANSSRLMRMLELIVIGFGGLTGLGSVLIWNGTLFVYLAAPFVILLLWMSCIRILAEMYMASAYRSYYDTQIRALMKDRNGVGFRSYGAAYRHLPCWARRGV